MSTNLENLHAIASANGAKLIGLSIGGLVAAAQTGATLIVISAASRDLSNEGAKLLLCGDGQAAWLVVAEWSRLIAWLQDEGILSISSDQIPDVHLTAQSMADGDPAVPTSVVGIRSK